MSKEKKHKDSKVNVVIIGIIVAIYAVFYGAMCMVLYKDIENPILLFYGIIPILLIVGIGLAVKMRIKEINENEIEEAKKY